MGFCSQVLTILITPLPLQLFVGLRRAVGNVSDCRYVSDCRSRVTNSIQPRSHTFVEIYHEIISTAILLPSADSRGAVVSYKRKFVHDLIFNRLVELVQEKGVVMGTDRTDMAIAVNWAVEDKTKQTNLPLHFYVD